jgi:hypothetical protein
MGHISPPGTEMACDLQTLCKSYSCFFQVPYFINELTITDIELGTEMPVIRKAYKPYLDERGLWIDVDIAYGGGFRMTLETKVNLMKLKKTSKDEEPKVYRPRDMSDGRMR